MKDQTEKLLEMHSQLLQAKLLLERCLPYIEFFKQRSMGHMDAHNLLIKEIEALVVLIY